MAARASMIEGVRQAAGARRRDSTAASMPSISGRMSNVAARSQSQSRPPLQLRAKLGGA